LLKTNILLLHFYFPHQNYPHPQYTFVDNNNLPTNFILWVFIFEKFSIFLADIDFTFEYIFYA